MHSPLCANAVGIIRIRLLHLSSPMVQQFWILTEDSLSNRGIKIIIHAPPSYAHGETMINVSDASDDSGAKRKQSDDLELATAWEAFVGSFTSSEPNLAKRTKEILRAELGQ